MKRWIRRWLARQSEDADLAAELQAHIEIERRERIESGASPEEAERAARQAFGNTTRIQEEVRDTWSWSLLERLYDDLRFGLRMLGKTPAWTAVMCATFALGIGFSTVIFSIAYGILWQPLPYPDAHRIMVLWPTASGDNGSRFNVSAALWLDWLRNTTSFDDIALTRPIANFNLTGEGTPERLQGARISYNVPLVLRTPPLFGRIFTQQEQRADAKVAILSYRFWTRRFGADPDVLGRKINLNGEPFEVIGVMPPQYRYPSADFELWTPLYIPPDEIRHGMNHQYIAIARLKDGVRNEQAQADVSASMTRLSQEFPGFYGKGKTAMGVLVESLAQSDAHQLRGTLYALLGAVACLLLIGCMNLAVLLIGRASARAREMAVRVALGASPARLRRQLLAEILPVSVAGAAGGILLASSLLKLLTPWLPARTALSVHAPSVMFAVGVSLLVVLIASLLPSRIAARIDPANTMQQSSRSISGAGGRARNILVMAQIAITVVLLLGGLLFVRSFTSLLKVSPGFESQGVLTMHFAVTRAKYREDEQVAAYYTRLLERIRSIPGVTQAGIVNRLPFSGIAQTGGIEFDGLPTPYSTDWRSATPGYFDALGVPLKQGRSFTERDTAKSTPVGVIDERLARQVFANASPIGRRFRRYLPGFADQDPWAEIVGVVGHVKNENLEDDPRPQVYWPETQRTQDRGALVVRTTGNPESFVQAVQEQIRHENPDQPVYDVRTMEQWMSRTLQSRSLLTGTVALFGAASLLLACLGLYGIVSYTANLRLREFGIRIALGAGTGQVRSLVLRHAAGVAIAGSAIGLALFWPIGRAVQHLLYGVTSADPISWLIAPSVLLAVALLAALGPARKVARTDPAITLRAE